MSDIYRKLPKFLIIETAAAARGGARAVPAAAAAARGRRPAASTGQRASGRVGRPGRGGWSIRVLLLRRWSVVVLVLLVGGCGG